MTGRRWRIPKHWKSLNRTHPEPVVGASLCCNRMSLPSPVRWLFPRPGFRIAAESLDSSQARFGWPCQDFASGCEA